MVQYEVALALENAALYVNENAPAMSGLALESLVSEYNAVQKMIGRLTRYYPEAVLKELIYHPELTSELMADQKKWKTGLQPSSINWWQKKATVTIIAIVLCLTTNVIYMRRC